MELKEAITFDPRRALQEAVPMTLRQQLPPEILELLEERINGRATLRVYQGVPQASPEPVSGSLTHRIAEFSQDKAYIANVYGRRATSVATTKNDSLNGIAIDNQFAVNEEPARVMEPGEIPDPSKTVTTSCPVSGIEVVPAESAYASVPEDTTILETPEDIVYLCGGYHKTTYYETYLYAEGSTGGPTPLTGILPAAPTPSLGVAKILYIPMTFADQNAIPATESKCYEVMRDVADYYAKASYGRLTTMTTVTPPVKLPHNEAWYVQKDTTNGGTVDGLGLELSHAREEAKRLGFDWNDYDCTVLRLNGGARVVGGWGSTGNVWIYSDGVGVTAHEIGHSFGLSHANYWDTAGTSAIGNGTNAEYGDVFDVMGSGGVPTDHYNAQAKNQIKWLPNDYVSDITQSGMYRVYAFDQPVLDPANRYAIKIVKDSQRTYWGEVRQLYNGNSSRPWADKGLILGWRFPSGGASNIQLIDTTPGSPFGKDDSPISLGRTFSDFESGIHLTTVAVSSTAPKYVDVVVNLGTFPGNRAPTLSLASSAEVIPVNATVTFTATASDADGDALAYSWQNFGDSSVRIVSPNSPTIARTFPTAGTYVVTCTVSDMKGGTTIRNKLITVGNGGGRYAISGRVTALGSGVPNVTVNANGTNSVVTDSDGYYVIPNLSPTTYSMTALLYGYAFSEIFNNSVTVGPNFAGADFVANGSPQVNITASTPLAAEAGLAAGKFTITRTGDVSQPLTVNVNTVSGTAAKTTDYSLSPDYVTASQGFSTFTIPGDQASLDIMVTPVDDAEAEGPETVILQLGPGTGYIVGTASSATVAIDDNDTSLPKVRIEATTPQTTENSGQPAVFTFRRSGATTGSLVVAYATAGTASPGSDYAPVPGTITIPSGASAATVEIFPVNDAVSEPTKTVVLTTQANAVYLVDPTASTAAATIADDDVQVVSITATDATATEVDLTAPGAKADTGTFLVTRSGDTSQALTVYYAVAGQTTGTPAMHGVDYDALPGVLVIPAGATSASITITPRWDNLGEGPEVVTVHLGGGSTLYKLSPTASSAVVTINDGSNPVYLEVIEMTNAAEPSTNGIFRLSARGSGTGTITVNYTISGTATAGSDYTLAGLDTATLTGSTTLTLNNGTVTKDLSVVPINEALAEELEDITLTITPDSAYTTYGPTSAATMWLRDDDQPTVYVDPHVTTYPPSMTENGSAAAFYLSRTGSTTNALVVNYAMGGTATPGSDYTAVSGTATIPAGAFGVDVTITPINDTTFEGTETIIMSLSPGAYGRGPSATMYLTDNETSAQRVDFASPSAAGPESATTVNIPVKLTTAATTPVTVEYVIDSGNRSSATSSISGVSATLTAPYWLRVVRKGKTHTSYFSTDGVTWVLHGAPQTIDIPDTGYLAGLMVSGGASGFTGTATFDNVTVSDLSPGGSAGALVNGVVNVPNPTGSYSLNSGVHTISAGGPDVANGVTDSCRFVHFPVSNSANCTITARVASLSGSAVSASAGVMIRESLGSSVRHYTANAIRDGSLRETYRVNPSTNGAIITTTKPTWIRLQRAGNVFSAFYSVNGTTWSQSGSNQTMALPAEVFVGFAVSAKADGQLSTATFDNISLTPGSLPALQGRTVGFVDAQGSDSNMSGVQTVTGSGAGIMGTQDECHFAAAPIIGDFTLTARVASHSGGAPTAQAGIMIRETTGYRSRMTYVGSILGSNLEFITRLTTVTNSFATGVDYSLASGLLTFDVGDTTKNIVLNVSNDSLPEPDEQITLALRNSNGALLGSQTVFVYTIVDDDTVSLLPTVGFANPTSSVPETSGTTLIPVSLGAPSPNSVTVEYAVTAGSATASSDFTTSAGTLTIPAGATIGYISVGVLDDSLTESPETVLVTLTNPTGATLNSSSIHTLTIEDNEFPVVTVAATDANASEDGDPGTFTFTRVGSTSGSLVVLFARSGTATSGTDFQTIATSGSVTIPNGQSTATVTVTPIQDTNNEGSETVILTITSSPTAYTVGAASSATVTIADDDRSTVSIVANDSLASETAGNPGQFTITRTAPTTGTLTVNLTITGTASNTSDYSNIATSISFSAGQSSRTINVIPVDDSITEGPEEVTLQLATGLYVIGGDSYANVTIADNDSPPSLFITSPGAQGSLIAPGNGLIVEATVTDDGAPQPLSLNWSQVTGPGVATFATPAAASSAVTFSAAGTYVLKLTATDGQFTVSDTVTVSVGTGIAPADWIAQDLGPAVSLRGQTFTQNGTYLLTGTGGGYAATASDTAHLMVRQVTGTSSVVVRLASVTSTATAPFAGITIRDSLARGARRAVLGYVPGTGLQFRTRTTPSINDSVATQAAVTLPVWLKLEYDGATNAVTGSYAPDAGGAPGGWSVVGSSIFVTMEGGSHLGLTSTSNNTTLTSTAAFDHLTLSPAPSGPALVAEDLGAASPTGIFTENGGTITIAANGSIDSSGSFYGSQYYGDLVVTAKLVDATSGAQSAKSGLMIRESMDSTAGYVLFGRIPQGAFNGYVWRTFAAGTGGGIPSFTGKTRWMRLIRKGNSITAFHAPDVSGAPGAWIQVGQPQTIIMSTPVLVGFAVDNSGGTGLNTATFSNLTVLPLNQAPVVNAGEFASSVVGPVSLSGSVTDDGFPTPPALVTQWLKVNGPAGVTFDNVSAPVTNARFTTDGPYTVRLSASDGSITTFDDVSLTAYASAFSSWQAANFAGGSSNPNALASLDADSDGLSNLLEYGLITSPNSPNTSPVLSDTVTIGQNRFLRLTVPKNPTATDLTYSVQATDSLSQPLSWSASGLIIEVDNGTTLRVRDNVPLGTTTAPTRFLRVFISRP